MQVDKKALLDSIIKESEDKYPEFLRERMESDLHRANITATKTEPLNKGAVGLELKEHEDAAEKKTDYQKFMEKAKKYEALQAEVSEVEEKLAEAKKEREEYYSSQNALGKTLLADHRRERSFIALEALVGEKVGKMILLKKELVADFENINDKKDRKDIYKYFEQNPDEIGLADSVLVHRTRENYADSQTRKLEAKSKNSEPATVAADLKKIQPKEEEKGDGIIPGIDFDLSNEKAVLDKETKTEQIDSNTDLRPGEIIKPTSTEPESVDKPAPSITYEMVAFGPEGNQTNAVKTEGTLKENSIPISQDLTIPKIPVTGIKAADEPIGKIRTHTTATSPDKVVEPSFIPNQAPIKEEEINEIIQDSAKQQEPLAKEKTVTGEKPAETQQIKAAVQNDNPIEQIKARIQGEKTSPSIVPEMQVDKKMPEAETPQATPGTEIENSLPSNENMAQPEMAQQMPEPQPSEANQQSIIQQGPTLVQTPEPSGRRGLFSFLRKKSSPVSLEATGDKVARAKAIANINGNELTSGHLAELSSEPNSTDQKLAA